MTDEFQSMREYLINSDYQDRDQAELFGIPILRRLAHALCAPNPSPMDLAVLLRHALRRQSELSGVQQTVSVPAVQTWPRPEDWAQFGISVKGADTQRILLAADPWCPEWLGVRPGDRSPEADACHGVQRRHPRPCPGDPFLRRLRRETYLNRGQREAVRAVLSAPPGSTLTVILPTGNGKSLCAHILSHMSLVSGRTDGLTIVAVPTVALAVDQARSVSELIGHRCDYVGGTDAVQKQQNADIRRRICEGTQGLVFASPEALLGSLKPTIYEASRLGLLKALVIDEAHLVETWGAEFRPAFQQLAGLRRGLIRASPDPAPPTVLLSATITQSCLDNLQHLFSGPGPFGVVAAVALRPEPSFWIAGCDDADQKVNRLDETLRHIPRPAILYTTRVNEAECWFRRLTDAGFRRLGLMTGRTSRTERDTLISRWAAGDLDLMVATSAFGLGVDQSEVRAVVHACVPETADRYYQEVGRAGRDGCASLSVVIHDPVDLKTGGEMARTKIIGNEKGVRRWGRMFEKKSECSGSELIAVSLETTPGPEKEYIDMVSLRNEAWNARTLTLMARAGILELDDVPPAAGASPDDQQDADAVGKRIVLRIRDHGHLDEDVWDERVEPVRSKTQAAERAQWGLMRRILEGRDCVSQSLEHAYELTGVAADGNEVHVPVARNCGGCASCRRDAEKPIEGMARPTGYPWQPQNQLSEGILEFTRSASVWALFGDAYPSTIPDRERLARIYKWLAEQGIRLVVGPETALAPLLGERSPISELPVFVQSDAEPALQRGLPSLPMLRIAPAGSAVDVPLSAIQQMQAHRQAGPLVVWLFPVGSASRDKPQTPLEQWLPCPRNTFGDIEVRAGL